MSDEKLKAWQERLQKNFSHKGVVGLNYLLRTKVQEAGMGARFDEKYLGHRILTDAFQEFFAETLAKQSDYNNSKGWPQDQNNYAACLMMFLTVFRTIRSSEVLSRHGYVLAAYSIQRSIKDQLWILCGAANSMAPFGELFGWSGMSEKWTDDEKAKVVGNRRKIEAELRDKILGKNSGLTKEAKEELQKWEQLFNWEAHRAIFSFFRSLNSLINKKKYDFDLGPEEDDLSSAMFMNRSMELNWLALRLMPFLRRSDALVDDEWKKKWKILDESFHFMFDGFNELGKKIAPAFTEMLNAKFKFDENTFFSEQIEAKKTLAEKS